MELLELPAPVKEAINDLPSFAITDAASYERAGEALKDITRRLKIVEEERFKITRPMDAAKDAVMELFRRPTRILTEAKATIGKDMARWDAAARAAAAEAERRIREERAAAVAESLKLAEMAAAEGDMTSAVELTYDAHLVQSAPVLATQAPKVQGVSFREVRHAEVTDMRALIIAAAQNPEAFMVLFTINMPVLKARLMAGERIPGTRLVTETTTAVRS